MAELNEIRPTEEQQQEEDGEYGPQSITKLEASTQMKWFQRFQPSFF